MIYQQGTVGADRRAGLRAGPALIADRLAVARGVAQQHPGGIVDLSLGSPVDPVPGIVREALIASARDGNDDGNDGAREFAGAAARWLSRRCGTPIDPASVLETVGSKEMIAALPALLGVGPGRAVAVPELAYPTYAAGAALCGADLIRCDDLPALAQPVALAWLNNPANPTGRVLPVSALRAIVRWARARDVILVCDECYLDFGWDGEPASVLLPAACDGSLGNILAVHSLSKRSNLPSYRIGFVAGDPGLIAALSKLRTWLGMTVAPPLRHAGIAALEDDVHVALQRSRYLPRRARLWQALESAGWRVDDSAGGLFLWAAHCELDGAQSVAELARAGILVAPGDFYGPRAAATSESPSPPRTSGSKPLPSGCSGWPGTSEEAVR